jgi:hypothetical protein
MRYLYVGLAAAGFLTAALLLAPLGIGGAAITASAQEGPTGPGGDPGGGGSSGKLAPEGRP